MKKMSLLWLTRTAMFLALTVLVQTVIRMFLQGIPQLLIVGTLVNLFLIAATVSDGFWSGFVVAVAAPVIAFFQGHLPPLVPVMMIIVALGNLVLVAVFSFHKTRKESKKGNDFLRLSVLAVIGAFLKFAALYLMVVQFVLPFFVANNAKIPDAAKNTLSVAFNLNFSWPQLVTALIAGFLFTAIYPTYKMISKKQ